MRATHAEWSVCVMAFNAEEKDILNSIFEKTTSPEKLRAILPDYIYDFLKTREFLGTISDKIFFRDANDFRPFSSCTLTKFLLPDLKISDLLTEIAENLSPDFLIFVDFHFLISCNINDDQNSEDPVLKFQRGSKASCINDSIKITSVRDLDDFTNGYKNFQTSDFLNEAFIRHSELFDYKGSGLRPHSLLALLVHIQKIK